MLSRRSSCGHVVVVQRVDQVARQRHLRAARAAGCAGLSGSIPVDERAPARLGRAVRRPVLVVAGHVRLEGDGVGVVEQLLDLVPDGTSSGCSARSRPRRRSTPGRRGSDPSCRRCPPRRRVPAPPESAARPRPATRDEARTPGSPGPPRHADEDAVAVHSLPPFLVSSVDLSAPCPAACNDISASRWPGAGKAPWRAPLAVNPREKLQLRRITKICGRSNLPSMSTSPPPPLWKLLIPTVRVTPPQMRKGHARPSKPSPREGGCHVGSRGGLAAEPRGSVVRPTAAWRLLRSSPHPRLRHQSGINSSRLTFHAVVHPGRSDVEYLSSESNLPRARGGRKGESRRGRATHPVDRCSVSDPAAGRRRHSGHGPPRRL